MVLLYDCNQNGYLLGGGDNANKIVGNQKILQNESK